MALRRHFGCLAALALAMCVGTACKDDAQEAEAPKPKASTVDLDKRCLQLGKVCGDKSKHVDKIVDACKQAAKRELEKGCSEKSIAAYDCYERELCGKSDKVWAIEDLGVLAERHGKCVNERSAALACVGK